MHRYTYFAAVGLLGLATYAGRTIDAEAGGLSMCAAQDEQPVMPDEIVPARDEKLWKQLGFRFEDSPLTSLEIEILPSGAEIRSRSRGTKAIKPLNYKASPSQLKKALTAFSARNLLRPVLAPGEDGGYSGVYLIGTITMTKKDGSFKLGISNVGFSIHGEEPNFSQLFYAPGGAVLLNTMYKDACGEPLPVDIKNVLSGRTFLETIETAFDRPTKEKK